MVGLGLAVSTERTAVGATYADSENAVVALMTALIALTALAISIITLTLTCSTLAKHAEIITRQLERTRRIEVLVFARHGLWRHGHVDGVDDLPWG